MRLIDADLLINHWLLNGENEHIYDTNAFLDSIDEQPTAFDKEKVIEELAQEVAMSDAKELRWILVKERLPEYPILAVDKFNQVWIPNGVINMIKENGEKIAFDGETYNFGSLEEFMKGKDIGNGTRVLPREIIAWMPLPEYHIDEADKKAGDKNNG